MNKNNILVMEERSGDMNILYCGDGNIKDGLCVSVLSLLKNVKEPLNIYIITMSLGERCAITLEFAEFLENRLKKENSRNKVTLIDITDLFCKNPPAANIETRFTPFCMLRLYADLIPELPDRILYLDYDVMCRKDFSEMYFMDMSQLELAGVLDRYGKWFFHRNIFKFDYMNSGVLLMNLEKIRETGLFSKCRNRCADKRMFMPDQSAINKLSDYKKLLPRKYNEQKTADNETVFHHFTTRFRFFPFIHTVTVKPWQREKLHTVLGVYEYDNILDEYENIKRSIKNEYNSDFLYN